jgi:dTMP kinase
MAPGQHIAAQGVLGAGGELVWQIGPLCRQLPRRQLFARSIVLAGLGLAEVAAAWNLFLALAAVLIVGAGAGIALPDRPD